MKVKTQFGNEEMRQVSNSDMIYFDHYRYMLRDHVYT